MILFSILNMIITPQGQRRVSDEVSNYNQVGRDPLDNSSARRGAMKNPPFGGEEAETDNFRTLNFQESST